jgi:radical SAM protein with 4Fe4S-binding SPASM domain
MKNLSDHDTLYPAYRLAVKRIKDFYAVLNPNLPNLMVADEEGKDFFEICDGKHTVGEIAKQLCQKYSSRGTTREDILQYASSLIQSGFIFTQPQSPPQKRVEPLEKLSQIYVHLTQMCNLRCKHCYINAGVKLFDELTVDENINLLRDFARLGGEFLVITGGEPFMAKKLLRKVVEAARRFNIKQISLETNGTLITEDDATFLKEHQVAVGVSLGGATSESHSFIRGEGTFDIILKNIKKLVAAGVNTKIGMTFAQPNLQEAEEIVYLAKKLGVDSATFNMVVIAGRAQENQDLAIPAEKILPAVRKVREASRKVGIRTVFEDILSGVKVFGRRDSCGAGIRSLSITADGDVYPCNSFIGSSLKAGNIREQGLEEIWRESPVLQEFQNLSVLDVDACRNCEVKFICAGGCLAETYRSLGNIKMQTPYCAMYKEIYSEMITELAAELWKQT